MIFGLDLGTRRVALACPQDRFTFVLKLEGARARREHPDPHDAGAELGRQVAEVVYDRYGYSGGHTFYCEKPFPRTHGKAANPRTVVGQCISLGSLAAHLPGTLRYDEPRVWKKELIGNGNADKGTCHAWLQAHRPALAEAGGQDPDLLDAFCLGVFAESMVAAGPV